MFRLLKPGLGLSLFLAIGILLPAGVSPVRAEEPQAPAGTTTEDGITYGTARKSQYWLAGLRGGLSIIPAKVANGPVKGDPGPHVNISFARVVDDIVAIGVMTEWESHDLKAGGVTGGTGHVVSIIPYAEARARLPGSKALITGSLGIGANLNFFDEAPGLGGKIKPDNQIAVRLALGTEYEIQKDVYLGFEMAYKTNNTKADVAGLGKDSYRYNSLAFLFGGKLAF